MAESPPPRPQLTRHQVIMLALSVYVIVALLVRELLSLSKQTQLLLDRVDTVICVYFLYDFGLRLSRAPNKWRFMRWA